MKKKTINLEKALKDQTKELKHYVDNQIGTLARTVALGFERMEHRFDAIESDLDVRSTVLNLDKRLQKVEHKLSHA